MPLDGPIAPGERESGCDRHEVFLEALGKAGQRGNLARARLRDPRREGVTAALAHEPQKRLAEGISLGDCGCPEAIGQHTAGRPAPASLRGIPR